MRLISAKEFAKLTGKHFTTVYRDMDDEKIPVVIIERKVKRIPWDDEKKEVCQAN